MFDPSDFLASLHNINASVDEMNFQIEKILQKNVGPTIEVPVDLLRDFLKIMRTQATIAANVAEMNATILDLIEDAARENEE